MNHLRQLLTFAAWVLTELGPAETLRRVRQRVLTLVRRQTYARWITDCEAPAVQAALATPRAPNGPLFSILMPVYNVEPRWLTQAIDSVLAQTYPHFELCIVDDASPRPELAPLLRSYASREPRIKLHLHTRNGHISQTSNSALAMATGDFVALLDHDDLLPPYALELLARELARFPDADLLYSDEDKIDEQGRRFAPYFKPDFNYDLLLTQNMISHLGVYRTALVRSAGGFREGLEGSQDYDLALRVCEKTSPSRIRHLPYVLYHWRVIPGSTSMSGDQKPYALLAAGRAITDHLQRQGVQAELLPGHGGTRRVKYALPDPPPLVSLILSPQADPRQLRPVLDGLRLQTSYRPLQVLVLADPSALPQLRAQLGGVQVAQDPEFSLQLLPSPQDASPAQRLNLAASHARGTVLGFLDSDLQPLDPDWLQELVSHALRKGLGAVGAKLLYADGLIQHAGLITGLNHGLAGSFHHLLGRREGGHMGRLQLLQQFSAVSAACLVLRKEVFTAADGFDAQHLPTAYYDLDLCLRLQERGLAVLYTPYAELQHQKLASRSPEQAAATQSQPSTPEGHYLRLRWGERLQKDPFYNPNLSLHSARFELAFPTRHIPFK